MTRKRILRGNEKNKEGTSKRVRFEEDCEVLWFNAATRTGLGIGRQRKTTRVRLQDNESEENAEKGLQPQALTKIVDEAVDLAFASEEFKASIEPLIEKGVSELMALTRKRMRGSQKIRQQKSLNLNVLSRCNQTAVHIFFRDLDTKKRDLIAETFLGHYLDISAKHLNRSLIQALVEKYDREKNGFNLGTKVIEFKVENVARYLGLPLDGELMEFERKMGSAPDIIRRLFHKEKIEPNHISTKLTEMRIRNDQDRWEFKILTVLYISSIFFFATTPRSVEFWLLDHLSDPSKDLNSLGWVKSIHKYLMDSVKNYSKGKFDSKKKVYIKGCTALLEIFAYENLQLEPKESDTYQASSQPLLFKWSQPDCTRLKAMRNKLDNACIAGAETIGETEKNNEVVEETKRKENEVVEELEGKKNDELSNTIKERILSNIQGGSFTNSIIEIFQKITRKYQET